MNRIMARLKGPTPSYRVLFEEDQAVDIGLKTPSIQEARPYEPLYVPETKREWFYVELDQDHISDMIEPYHESNTLGSAPIQQPEYTQINAIYVFKGRRILFTRVLSSALVGEAGKQVISFGEEGPETSELSFSVELSGQVDAFYDGAKRIYFQSYTKAKALFKGFEVFYQEASREDKEVFLENDLFAVGEINPDYIGLREAKQIDAILKDFPLDLNASETHELIRAYAQNYPLAGVRANDKGQLVIANKEDLQCVLKLLDQRYFTSELSGDKLEARAATKMKNQKSGLRRDGSSTEHMNVQTA